MRRDPSTEEEEMRRRPPLPPPATQPSKNISGRLRSPTYPPPPQRAGSATETSTPRARGTMWSRPQDSDNPLQRTMPRRGDVLIGRPTHEERLATPHRPPATEQQGSSRQWEDRGARWEQPSGGRWEQREYQDRSRSSRQWQGNQQWTEQFRYGQERQDWSSQQGWTSRTQYRNAGS